MMPDNVWFCVMCPVGQEFVAGYDFGDELGECPSCHSGVGCFRVEPGFPTDPATLARIAEACGGWESHAVPPRDEGWRGPPLEEYAARCAAAIEAPLLEGEGAVAWLERQEARRQAVDAVKDVIRRGVDLVGWEAAYNAAIATLGDTDPWLSRLHDYGVRMGYVSPPWTQAAGWYETEQRRDARDALLKTVVE